MVIFELSFAQFYPQKESNLKEGFLHQILNRNFDRKWVSLARNEANHLVLPSINGARIFVVWSPPYQLRVLPNLFEFFEHAEKNIFMVETYTLKSDFWCKKWYFLMQKRAFLSKLRPFLFKIELFDEISCFYRKLKLFIRALELFDNWSFFIKNWL